VINYFVGKEKPELEAWLEQAQEDLAAGRSTTRVNARGNAGGVDSEEVIEIDVRTRIEQLLFALNQLDPVAYPASSCRRVSRTQVEVYPYWANGAGIK
jgi:hypothetical protein